MYLKLLLKWHRNEPFEFRFPMTLSQFSFYILYYYPPYTVSSRGVTATEILVGLITGLHIGTYFKIHLDID